MKKIIGLGSLLLMIGSVLQAQSLLLEPHFNLLFPTSRLSNNSGGYHTFAGNRFCGLTGDLGLFLSYKSKQRWRVSMGVTRHSVGIGYKISYRKPSALVTGIDLNSSRSNTLHRVPILFIYDWKNVRLFQLRNYRKIPDNRRPRAIDDGILYALLFKVQPIIGVSYNYMGQISGWNDPSDTLDIRYPDLYYDIYHPVTQLSAENFAVITGVRLQFYSFGRDRWILTVLYNAGLQDMLEMDVQYTIDGNGPYRSQVRSRGSGLSVTLSYPIRIYNFNKQERQLRRGLEPS